MLQPGRRAAHSRWETKRSENSRRVAKFCKRERLTRRSQSGRVVVVFFFSCSLSLARSRCWVLVPKRAMISQAVSCPCAVLPWVPSSRVAGKVSGVRRKRKGRQTGGFGREAPRRCRQSEGRDWPWTWMERCGTGPKVKGQRRYGMVMTEARKSLRGLEGPFAVLLQGITYHGPVFGPPSPARSRAPASPGRTIPRLDQLT